MDETTLIEKTFKKGERIVTEGKPAYTAYLIDEGKVRVFLEQEGKMIDLAELGPDEIFGESALIQGARYGANVEALEDTVVTLITPKILEIKMSKCDPMLKAIIQMLLERQRRTNQALLESETREFIDVGFI